MNSVVQPGRLRGDLLPAGQEEWGAGPPAPAGYPAWGEPAPEGARARGRLALLRLLDVVRGRKLLIAAICALSLAAGLVEASLTLPVYEAVTTIQIDQQAPKVLNGKQPGGAEDYAREPFFFQTQYELLKSRSLAERVARGLDPAEIAALSPPPTPSLTARLRAALGGRAPEADPPPTADAIEAAQARIVGLVAGGLSVQPVPMSRIVRVAFASPSPALAQRISAAVADNFVASTLDRRVEATAYARGFFEERLQQLKLKLEESEKQVVAYARREGIAAVDERQPEPASRLGAIDAALSAATAERIRHEQLWAQARSGNDLGLPQVMADRSVQAARERRAQLMTEYQDKLNLLKPAFPEMVQLRAQMSELDRQIRAQVDLVKESIRAQFEAARAQERSLARTLAELRDQALDLRTRSIQYNILQRELDTNKALYDGLLQQYKELGVSGALGTNNVSIVDRAELPGAPTGPRTGRTLVLALIAGLALSAAVVYVLELLDDSFKGAENLEEALGLSALGVIPLAPEARTPIEGVLSDPRSAVAEAYRSLRTALQFSTEAGVPRVLLVTSAKPGEGKSTTAVSLGANFAQLGLRVLLIDADLRSPSLAAYLEAEGRAGLSNVLAGAAEVGDVAQACAVEGVRLIAAGPPPPNPAELLAGPRMARLLAQAGEAYDLVLIDGPPVMGLADAPILSSLAAGTLLVVQANGTRRALARAAVKRLRFARARLVGAALSKFDAGRSGYSYAYGYAFDAYPPGRGRDAGAPSSPAARAAA